MPVLRHYFQVPPTIYFGNNQGGDTCVLKMITEVEQVIRFLGKPYNVQETRSDTIPMSSPNSLKKQRKTTRNTGFLNIYLKTKKFSKAHEDLYITNSDKSNCTVVMNKVNYETKMDALVEDTTRMSKNPILQHYKM